MENAFKAKLWNEVTEEMRVKELLKKQASYLNRGNTIKNRK